MKMFYKDKFGIWNLNDEMAREHEDVMIERLNKRKNKNPKFFRSRI